MLRVMFCPRATWTTSKATCEVAGTISTAERDAIRVVRAVRFAERRGSSRIGVGRPPEMGQQLVDGTRLVSWQAREHVLQIGVGVVAV